MLVVHSTHADGKRVKRTTILAVLASGCYPILQSDRPRSSDLLRLAPEIGAISVAKKACHPEGQALERVNRSSGKASGEEKI
jgi:hypothetical protein